MREKLEEMRDALLDGVGLESRGDLLTLHDGITAMIDTAEELAGPIVTVAPISAVRDMLNECLSNALTPFVAPKKKKSSTRPSPRDYGHRGGWPRKKKAVVAKKRSKR